MFVVDTFGRDEFERICRAAGLDPATIEDQSQWIDYEHAAAFLSGVRDLLPDEEAFMHACSYRMKEGFGPLLLALPAATPKLVFAAIARTARLFSNVVTCDMEPQSRTEVMLRYVNARPELETRELCLSRMAATRAIPRMFGLPEALIAEHSCMARGDEACEYVCRFYTRTRWLPSAIGVATGALCAWGLSFAGVTDVASYVALPALFGLIGLVWELRRTAGANVAHAQEIQAALAEVAEHEGDARREIVAFHERQRHWGTAMEEQVGDRTRQLQELVARIEAISEARVSSVRGFSHDLRSPLQALRLYTGMLALKLTHDKAMVGLLQDAESAIDQMDELLGELAKTARADAEFVRLTPAQMQVDPWVDKLRRRVKALAFGKDIRVSVFRSREAPEQIETDLLVFERVVDNLCSNAAKYTDRGSIVIEIDGRPGFLTLKVSDTGRGIQEERIRQVFEPGGSDERSRAPRSLGVGLSVVVQLLAQLGGKLEVMSKPEQGTTFWAHFPTELPKRDPTPDIVVPKPKLADVVTIRRNHSR